MIFQRIQHCRPWVVFQSVCDSKVRSSPGHCGPCWVWTGGSCLGRLICGRVSNSSSPRRLPFWTGWSGWVLFPGSVSSSSEPVGLSSSYPLSTQIKVSSRFWLVTAELFEHSYLIWTRRFHRNHPSLSNLFKIDNKEYF